MQKTIIYTVTKNDYVTFNIVHHRRYLFYYIPFLFLVVLIENPREYSFISIGITALLITAGITVLILAIIVSLIYLQACRIYKLDKELQMKNEILFANDTFTVQDERGSRIYYYTDIYKIKRVKTLLLIYVSPLKTILIPASSSYDIAELHDCIRQYTQKNDNST